MKYTLISPEGVRVRFDSLKDVANRIGGKYQSVANMLSGHAYTYKNWWSTRPEAVIARKKRIKAFVNIYTLERDVSGHQSHFAKKHEVALVHTNRLINGKAVCVNGWVLEETYNIIQEMGGMTCLLSL